MALVPGSGMNILDEAANLQYMGLAKVTNL